jgi:hypothetical protein
VTGTPNTLTALEAVQSGQCSGLCLVAETGPCDCQCAGAFHGALADTKITAWPASLCGAKPPAHLLGAQGHEGTGVRCEKPACDHPLMVIHDNGSFGAWIGDAPGQGPEGAS